MNSLTPEMKAGIRLWLRKQVGVILVLFLLLFLIAGDWGWGLAWIQFGLYSLTKVVEVFLFIRWRPDLLVERSDRKEGTQAWDMPLVILAVMVLPISTWVLCGLQHRFGWGPELPGWVVVLGIVLWLIGDFIILTAMWFNTFFAGTVRLQEERGHQVVSSGPYRVVRHPGYAGMLFLQMGVPLTLASFWGLIPSLLVLPVLLMRTAKEDMFLQENLTGYKDYTQQTRWRLFPGVW